MNYTPDPGLHRVITEAAANVGPRTGYIAWPTEERDSLGMRVPKQEPAIVVAVRELDRSLAELATLRQRLAEAEAKAHGWDVLTEAILSTQPHIGSPSPEVEALLDWVKLAKAAESARDAALARVARLEGEITMIAMITDSECEGCQKILRRARAALSKGAPDAND